MPRLREAWVFDWHKANHKRNEPSKPTENSPSNGFLEWLIPALLVGPQKLKQEAIRKATKDFTDVRITVQVNGIDVNPGHFFASVERNMDWMVGAEVNSYIEKRLDDMFTEFENTLDLSHRVLRRGLRKRLRETGLTIVPDDWENEWAL